MKLRIHPDAVQDIDDIFDYIAIDNPDAARRVYKSMHESFDRLLETPMIGRIRQSNHVPGLRTWRIEKFPTYIILYRTTEIDVQILRILHGARDIDAMFD
jgi:toxin ParE1/3/4